MYILEGVRAQILAFERKDAVERETLNSIVPGKTGRRRRLFRCVGGNGDDCWAISVDGSSLLRDRLSGMKDSWLLRLDPRV